MRLTINDRNCTVDVLDLADDCPVLIGQIPLEGMDFVVDPVGQRLIGNPDHDGDWMVDCFCGSGLTLAISIRWFDRSSGARDRAC